MSKIFCSDIVYNVKNKIDFAKNRGPGSPKSAPGTRAYTVFMQHSWMTPQSSNYFSIFRDNNGLCLTVFRLPRVAVAPVRRNGIRQPPICVPVVRSKDVPHCRLLSDEVKWRLVSTTLMQTMSLLLG